MNNIRLNWQVALFVLLVVEVLFLLAVFPQHVYDVPTAMFFTLALALLQREKFRLYVWLFPWICLNRETAILITLLFAVYFFNKLDRRLYLYSLGFQLVVFVFIRLALVWTFVNSAGQSFYFNPAGNLQMYAHAPKTTLLFLAAAAAILVLVAIKWKYAPALMRTAFLIFAPVLGVLYFLIGRSFEVRFFIELLPVIAIIGTS